MRTRQLKNSTFSETRREKSVRRDVPAIPERRFLSSRLHRTQVRAQRAPSLTRNVRKCFGTYAVGTKRHIDRETINTNRARSGVFPRESLVNKRCDSMATTSPLNTPRISVDIFRYTPPTRYIAATVRDAEGKNNRACDAVVLGGREYRARCYDNFTCSLGPASPRSPTYFCLVCHSHVVRAARAYVHVARGLSVYSFF